MQAVDNCFKLVSVNFLLMLEIPYAKFDRVAQAEVGIVLTTMVFCVLYCRYCNYTQDFMINLTPLYEGITNLSQLH